MRVAAISDIHGNLPALEAVLAAIDEEDVDEIVVGGDTVHGPWPAEVIDLRTVNPGSVGIPYEGVRGAYWALLGPEVEFRRTEYDVDAAVAAIEVMRVPVDGPLLEQLVEPPDSETTTRYFESVRGA